MIVLLAILFLFGGIIWEKIDLIYFYPKRKEEYDKRLKDMGLF